MKILFVSHVFSRTYNRKKLTDLAKSCAIGAIFPLHWHDALLDVDRDYEKTSADDSLTLFPQKVFFPGKSSLYFFHPILLFHALKKFSPDIIQVDQEATSLCALQINLLNSLFFHRKVILFCWENIDRPFHPFLRLTRFLNLRLSTALICGNEEAKNLHRDLGFKKQIFVLPQFGVDTEIFHKTKKLPDDKPLFPAGFTVGFVGRLTKEKGIDVLVEALQFLPEKINLTIISSMTTPVWLQDKLDQSNLKKRVTILNSIPHHDFPKYYSQMDVLVIPSQTTPSWKEQFGLVAAEAMACATPVIGSNSGAIPEVIGDAGLIFQEDDPKELAAHIKRLTNDPQADQFSKKSLDRAKTLFSKKAVAAHYLKAYQEIYGQN